MGKAQTNEKHPKGFYACCITFMFERLAFYGAKPIGIVKKSVVVKTH